MKDKKKELEQREKVKIIKHSKILDMLSIITDNTIQEIELLITTSFSEKLGDETVLFDKINDKNDNYSQAINDMLAEDIFLPINKYDLLLVYEAFEDLSDKTEQLSHRIGLIELPEWVENHLNSMLDYLFQMFKLIQSWVNRDFDILNLDKIQDLEIMGDKSHQLFLHKLYDCEIHYKVFKQSEFLDLIVEKAIDAGERLANRLYNLIRAYQSSNEHTTYLS